MATLWPLAHDYNKATNRIGVKLNELASSLIEAARLFATIQYMPTVYIKLIHQTNYLPTHDRLPIACVSGLN